MDELLRSTLAVRGILASPQLAPAARETLVAAATVRGVTLTELDERDFATAADTDSPQGVLAIGEAPVRALDALALPATARLVVLDGVQDPGNVGTILRTAAALGAAATLALPGTVDLWNAKVVRSAMGALFHHAALSCTWDELDSFLGEAGAELWGADAAGEPVDRSRGARPARLALAVGNEGAGLSADARARVRRLVGLPIASQIESLNVAVATGILLYELRP